MKARPSLQFYPSDWLRDPGLRSCSLEARGLWIDSISFMHEGEPYGHLTLNGHDIEPATLARMVGSSLRDVQRALAELETAGVLSRTEKGTIFSRRMVRDEEVRNKRAEGGRLSLNHPDVPHKKDKGKDTFKDTLLPSSHGSFGGSPSSSSSSSSSSSKEKEEEKRAGSTSSTPAVNPTSTRKVRLADEEFLDALRQNPAYAHIDIATEMGKLSAWLKTPRGSGKQCTRARVVNWLNRAVDEQKPLSPAPSLSTAHVCSKRLQGDRFLRPCGQPASPHSRPTEPRCEAHLSQAQNLGASAC